MERCLPGLQRTVLYLVPVRAQHGGAHPIDLTPMDCGTPWADREEHQAQQLELSSARRWMRARQPAATNELKPGTYRIVLMADDMKELWSEGFSFL